MEIVHHDDGRAAMEADLKSDKHGLGLGVLRKRKLAAQQMLGLLGQLAHNVLVWARHWLTEAAPRLATLGARLGGDPGSASSSGAGY